MIVVSDTTAITSLLKIGRAEVETEARFYLAAELKRAIIVQAGE